MKKQNDSDKYLLLQEQSAEMWNYLLTFFARFSVNFPCWHKCKSAYSLTNWLTLALSGFFGVMYTDWGVGSNYHKEIQSCPHVSLTNLEFLLRRRFREGVCFRKRQRPDTNLMMRRNKIPTNLLAAIVHVAEHKLIHHLEIFVLFPFMISTVNSLICLNFFQWLKLVFSWGLLQFTCQHIIYKKTTTQK